MDARLPADGRGAGGGVVPLTVIRPTPSHTAACDGCRRGFDVYSDRRGLVGALRRKGWRVGRAWALWWCMWGWWRLSVVCPACILARLTDTWDRPVKP